MKQGFIPPVPPPLPNDRPFTYEAPGRRTKSMLTWWALLPLACFGTVEAVYGWDVAVKRATAPDLALSYFCGSVVGGLLISLGVAWVVYRATSRSRYAATLAFTGLILLFCGAVVQQAYEVTRLRDAAPGGDSTVERGRHQVVPLKVSYASDGNPAAVC